MKEEDCIKILSPSTESELTKLLIDNVVCGLGLSIIWVIVLWAAVGLCSLGGISLTHNIFLDMIAYLLVACLVLYAIVLVFSAPIFIFIHIMGGGDIVGGWCRNKVFAAPLMINVFNLISSENRLRTLNLLHRIKQEFEDPELALIDRSLSS